MANGNTVPGSISLLCAALAMNAACNAIFSIEEGELDPRLGSGAGGDAPVGGRSGSGGTLGGGAGGAPGGGMAGTLGGRSGGGTCGNGLVEPPWEECEGSGPVSATCGDVTFGARTVGTVICSPSCTYNDTGCRSNGAGGMDGSGGMGTGGMPFCNPSNCPCTCLFEVCQPCAGGSDGAGGIDGAGGSGSGGDVSGGGSPVDASSD